MRVPARLRDVDKLEQAIEEAHQIAQGKGLPLTLERLAVVAGINRQDLTAIINGHKVKFDDGEIAIEVVSTLKKAVDNCVADVMDHGMTRGNNPIMPIFNLKCNHGYDDKPQTQNNVTVVINDNNIPD